MVSLSSGAKRKATRQKKQPLSLRKEAAFLGIGYVAGNRQEALPSTTPQS
jgi:hypothetical protein